MRTLFSLFIQFLFLSASSASIFLISNVVYPLRSEVSHQPTQISRMTIHMEEFSPAFAAMEDDYYISTFEEEKIPTNVVAKEIKPGTFDLVSESEKPLALPKLSINTRQSLATNDFSQTILRNLQSKDGAQTLEMMNTLRQANESFVPHHWIQGKIELTEGLAISDPRDVLQVAWFVDGKKRRDGKIFYQDGSYEIKVDRMEGELIAELADSKGFLLGEVIVDLDLLSKQRNINTIIVGGVDLRLSPYDFAFKGQTISVYQTPVGNTDVSLGQHDAQFRSKENGRIREESISPHSTALLLANNYQFRDSVLLADLEKEQTIRMFPEKYMVALFETIDLPKEYRDDGVIWGLVQKGKTPSAGYKARIPKDPSARAIYFNMYIANRELDKTGVDGQYVFVGLNEGEYEVEILNELDQVVDSKIIVVRSGAVTEASFDVGDRKNLKMRPFDPLSPNEKPVEMFALGQNETKTILTENILDILVSQGNDPLLVYSKVDGAKVESATFASRNKKIQDVPVLNVPWWESVQKTYNIQIKMGVIIGFIDADTGFEVFVEQPREQTKILYFNQQGQIIKDRATSGQKPSGFVIYGIGQGLHTLIIESEQGMIHSEAAYVDGEAIALTYKSI